MADRDDERRDALRDFYEKLSPVEKQRRVVLEPTFRDAYNEITQADRFSPVPWYFWEKWAPRLNPLLITVYLKIRTFVFFNRQTGERREVVWPKQETLAAQVGSNRKSVMKALRELESLGFISSEKGRLNHPKTGHLVNGTKKYQVFFELPLVAEDAVELLLRETAAKVGDGGSIHRESQIGTFGSGPVENSHRESQIGTFGSGPVENSHRESQIGTRLAVPNRDSKTITRTNTQNVSNVEKSLSKNKKEPRLRDHSTVRAMTDEERNAREGLAWEVGESLKTWAGDRDGGQHKSYGFHLRVCYLMPEVLIREALAATRDAVEEQRSGRKSIRSLGGYFGRTVQALASEHGIDLDVGWKGAPPKHPKAELRAQSPVRAPDAVPPPRTRAAEAHESEDFVPMPEATREALRAILGDSK